MITLYALLIERCGLTLREAADYHDVSIDTIRSWCIERHEAPPGVIAELRELYARIERAAEEALKIISENNPDEIEFGLAADDHEAQTLGWPCVGHTPPFLALWRLAQKQRSSSFRAVRL